MTTYFIADLHLDDSRPDITQLFIEFLDSIKLKADELYILGDLFEYWIGDDVLELKPEACPNTVKLMQTVVAQLKALADSGVNIYLGHGNRDFLIGDQFAQAVGASLLDEMTVIDLYGTPTLLMHGDTLCTDDIEYQQLRVILRNPQWQADFLSKSIQDRIKEADNLRLISQKQTKDKQADSLDVNQQQVEKIMREFNVRQLIHGHTHRPATHEFLLDNLPAKRIVLADWYQQSSWLKVDSDK
ncbi:MAG TPA: UDP-2,3-diacylglucosamine diphosphatase [Leucothrix mucor]|uniref:UDP-2,3-diacylglucosamine hydrolase n=1 Tax=Leucothrix mucor TaxID=45248 RepID=A0A7V2WVA0_LEUMU|nr:UDP-2,3-diacylglucosamine diphosphatase [Leucothrix mucor]